MNTMNTYFDNSAVSNPMHSAETLSRIEAKLDALEKREKQRRLTGIIITAVVLLALAVGMVLLLPKLNALAKSYETAVTVIEQTNTVLDELELEKLSSTVDFLAGIDYDALRKTLDMFNQVDVQEIIDSLTEIQGIVGKMAGLDVEGITDSLNKLQEIIAPLLKLLGK